MEKEYNNNIHSKLSKYDFGLSENIVMKIILLNIILIFSLRVYSTNDHHELRIQVQGTFSPYKHYPSFGLERTVRKNNIIRMTIGGGPLATRNRTGSLSETPYYSGNGYYETVLENKSNYTGVLIKLSNLVKIYKDRKIEIRGGFDLGGYLINDNYSLVTKNNFTGEIIHTKGNYVAKAVSMGMLMNFKRYIGNEWFVILFPQAMCYLDYWPSKMSIYDKPEPFFNWEIELGIGIGYTIIR